MTMSNQRHNQVTIGDPVVTQNGEQLGKVKEIEGRYFKVDAPMQPDYWLPLDIVGSSSGGQVMLSLASDRLGEYRVNSPDDLRGDRDVSTGAYRATTTDELRGDTIVRDDDIIRAGERDRMRDVRTDERDSVVLHEERLSATTHPVEAGEVRLEKDIVEEQQTIDVPVRREEVFIERRPITDGRAEGEIGDDPTTIRVPVMTEEVEVRKEVVATEEVGIGKRSVHGTERVSDTVRREEVDIETTGDVNLTETDRATLRREQDGDVTRLDETRRMDDPRRTDQLPR